LQLHAIPQSNAIKGNGLLSLAHQLITADLNVFYGAVAPPAVAAAIAQANALIGSLSIPPIGTATLANLSGKRNRGRAQQLQSRNAGRSAALPVNPARTPL
jgi:phage-related tail protein